MAVEQQVLLPDIGDFPEVDVIEVLVKPGDHVAAEDPLITLESDKATMEIPSPHAGIVRELAVKVGDKIAQGSLIAVVAEDETADALKDDEEITPPATIPTTVAPPPRPQPADDTQQVQVPDLGDFDDVEVIEILVKPGDKVAAETALITLESDKATMEIPSPSAGTVTELVGDRVSTGAPIVMLAVANAGKTSPPPVPPQPMTPQPDQQQSAARQSTPGGSSAATPAPPSMPAVASPIAPAETSASAHASPSIRKFARALGVDLHLVSGSGRKGRILQADLNAFVKGRLQSPTPAGGTGFSLPAVPEIDFSKFGEIETRALSKIKRLSGKNLHRSWITAPHVTQFDEADISDLEEFRQDNKAAASERGVKLTLLSFLMKAAVVALKEYPEFNSSLAPDGESLVLKKYFHIGFAADTPQGLMVPVIRDVDKKGLFDIAAELQELSAKARDKKITPGEMQGASFTISSLGGIGGTAFTPIINVPEVAILGVSRSVMQPVYSDGELQARLILPLSLSYDHRVIDGAAGARFTTLLSTVLSDIRKVLL